MLPNANGAAVTVLAVMSSSVWILVAAAKSCRTLYVRQAGAASSSPSVRPMRR